MDRADGYRFADPQRPWASIATLLAGMTAWLWPIGVGGQMPVGGDVTQFSIGLMAVLSRALKSGRLPLWNDLWGFGFPGLAESQMGVFYPPHLALYGLLTTEAAYTASLVLHTYWAALGAYWASRCFGISRWGSALCGFSWAASGVYLIHLPHQWGYTTGSWMPWAIGLAYLTTTDETRRGRHSLVLAAVLAMQVLPGHFQFAFMTQVAVLGIALAAVVERPRSFRGSTSVVLAFLFAAFLSAMQIEPTLQLAKSANSQRTFAYLSAFPATPIHLINFVAPNLFHGSPMWRSVAWDPFHAMPEEHRPYVGLVPLFLALGAIRCGWRADRGIRLLSAIAFGALILSLGPYVPGFGLLTQLPGFSFFRAPARWSLLTTLTLSLLAGKGFDAWTTWPRVGRGVVRFVVTVALAVVLVAGATFLAIRFGQEPVVRGIFEPLMKLLPWPVEHPFDRVIASSRVGPTDSLVFTALIRDGTAPQVAARMTLNESLGKILFWETIDTIGLLLILLAIAPVLAKRSRAATVALLFFAGADILLLSRHRDLETAPIRPLVEQSSVLKRLASLPYGSRTIDPLRNLPMIAGAAPISAYRTLDRPVVPALVNLASSMRDGAVPNDRIDAATRLLGTSVRVFDVFERNTARETIVDPVLASWLYGRWGEANPSFAKFGVETARETASRIWFVPGSKISDLQTNDPNRILDLMKNARPGTFQMVDPEHFDAEIETREAGVLVVTVLNDYAWSIRAHQKMSRRHLTLNSVFPTPGGGAWQAVEIPGAGTWRFSWSYRFFFYNGIAGPEISLLAWMGWAWLMFDTWRQDRRRARSVTN